MNILSISYWQIGKRKKSHNLDITQNWAQGFGVITAFQQHFHIPNNDSAGDYVVE